MSSDLSSNAASPGVSEPSIAGTQPVRSSHYTAAALLNILVSVVSIGFAAPLLGGYHPSGDDQAPAAVLIAGLVLGVLGLAGSYGVWRVQRWGVILTIVLNVLQFLSGVPGIAFAPPVLKVVSVVGCIVNVVIIWLLVNRRTRVEVAR